MLSFTDKKKRKFSKIFDWFLKVFNKFCVVSNHTKFVKILQNIHKILNVSNLNNF